MIQNNENSEYSVAKILPENSGTSASRSFVSEAKLHEELDHPRIIKFEGFHNDLSLTDAEGNQMEVTAIRSELASVGDLFDLLCIFDSMPPMIARFYAKQMVEAVAYLHEEKGIAHRDIKLENVLIDDKFGTRLTDFGFSCKTDKETKLTDQAGTYEYSAPEQHEKAPYNGFEADIFSLGVAIFILVAGRMPFAAATKDDEFYVHFVNREEEKFWEMQEECVEYPSSQPFFKREFRELMNGMLRYRASERMTIKEVMDHPWLQISPKVYEKSGEVVGEFLKKKGVTV